MKKLFTHLPLILLSTVLITGCGKENNTGGGAKDGLTNSIGADGYGTGAQNYANVQELRSAFDKKSLADGLQSGQEFYHVGSYFNESYSNGSNLDYSYCIDLIFWQSGDCDQEGGNHYYQQMMSTINQGRLLQVQSANADSVSLKEAVGVDQYNQYDFQSVADFTRSSSNTYYEMLGAGGNANLRNATITLSNGTVLQAVMVDYNGNKFVVTTNLPVAANPVTAVKSNGLSQGYLVQVNDNIRIKNVKVDGQIYLQL